jgi:hypothetical protein
VTARNEVSVGCAFFGANGVFGDLPTPDRSPGFAIYRKSDFPGTPSLVGFLVECFR